MKQSLSETHPHFHRVYFVVVFLLICLNLRMSFSAADPLLGMLEQEQQTRRELEQRLLPPAPEAPAEREEIILETRVENAVPERAMQEKTEVAKKGFIARLLGA